MKRAVRISRFLSLAALLALSSRWPSSSQAATTLNKGRVTLSPTKLTFGTQLVGSVSDAKLVTVFNGTNQTVTLDSITVAGDFDSPSKTCGSSLSPGGRCSISITFAPTGIGPRTGSISVKDQLGNTNTTNLAGIGTSVELAPKGLDFGAVAVGSVGQASVTVENEGFSGLTIFGVGITGANGSAFSIAHNGCGTIVNADHTCKIEVSFAPTIQTTQTASLKISDDGGGSPQVVPLTGIGGNPIPAINQLSPKGAKSGGRAFTLTVSGTNFIPSSVVEWNGNSRPTTFISNTQLKAAILASDIAVAGSAAVTVLNPAPAGGQSNILNFSIIAPNPVPSLNSISPASVPAGGSAFTLSLNGFNFVSNSVVRWNGSNRPTTFVDGNDLQAKISANDIANPGTSQVSVFNPAPGGGTSNSAAFTITFGASITALNLTANGLVWDPYTRQIYASLPSIAGANGNSITAIDPFARTVGISSFAGSEPNRLAISDDGQFLYVGLNGGNSVQRMLPPTLSRDINIPLGSDPFFGPYFALDLQVAPGAAHTTAITLGNSGVSPAADGGVTIFDDATARPTTVPGFSGTGHLFDSLQWGADATALYAANNEDTGFDFYTMSVNSSGVVLNHDYPSTFSSFSNAIHFDAGTKLIYSDDGHVVDPATGLPTGSFAASGLMVPDSTLGRAFFLGTDVATGALSIFAFNQSQFSVLGNVDIPSLSGSFVVSFIRWGQNGLAFNTLSSPGAPGKVILLTSSLVLPPSSTDNPVPTASTLAPTSATAGGQNFQLTVDGSGFVLGSVVRWNGQDRTTKFVSGTQLIAYIPATDIAAAGTAQVTIFNPTPGGGLSNAVLFTVSP